MKGLIALLIILNAAFTTASAQWVSNGPYTGTVQCMAVSDSGIYAGLVYGGVYQSTDSGGSWVEVSNGLTDTFVYSLAIMGNMVFAGTYTGGVFRTTSNGAYWVQLDSGLVGGSSIVYCLAASGSGIFAGTDDGVYLSADSGNTWLPVNGDISINNISSLALSGGSGILAGTSGSGVYLSTNNGGVWSPVNNGLTDPLVLSLAADSPILYAGTDGGGVFYSANNGSSWAAVNNGLTGYTTAIYSLLINGNTVYAGTDNGLFQSTNNGADWEQVGLGGIQITSLAITDSIIYCGGDTGGVWYQPIALLTPSTGIPPVPVQGRFKIYPNPSVGNWQLTVGNELIGSALEIYDAEGRLVLKDEVRSTKYEVTAGTLASGIYIATLKTATGLMTQKLVVER